LFDRAPDVPESTRSGSGSIRSVEAKSPRWVDVASTASGVPVLVPARDLCSMLS
jgi:hypothetical protein